MVYHPRILDRAFDVRDIPPLALLLLIVMARLGNASAQCFASQETLATRCCCSDRTVRRLLRYLRENKFVTRIPNPKGSTDRYVLNFHLWCLGSGQIGRGKRPSGPVGAGQTGRQNPNGNPKLNRGGAAAQPERSRSAARVDRLMLQKLDRLGEAVEQAHAAKEAAHG